MEALETWKPSDGWWQPLVYKYVWY